MSVIVKHMEMPKGCGLCRFDDYGYCTMAEQYSGGSATHGRASFCPLVELPEKHGDLIDRNKLIESKFKNDISYAAFVNLVKRQVAVVKAEGEE